MQQYTFLWDCFDIGIIDYNIIDNKNSNKGINNTDFYFYGLKNMAASMAKCIKIIMDSKIDPYEFEQMNESMLNKDNPYITKFHTIKKQFFNFTRITNNNISDTIIIPKYKPHNFTYNKKSVVIMDGLDIPEPIQITVSLGTKFVYDTRFSIDVYNAYQSTITNTQNNMMHVDFICLTEMKQTLKRIKFDNINRCSDINRCFEMDKWTDATKGYLRQCLYATNLFFKTFDSIFVINSDKGNNMVILNKNTYHSKLSDHINDGIDKGIYTNFTLTQDIINNQFTAYYNIYGIYKKWMEEIKANKCKHIPSKLINHRIIIQDHTFYAAHIYGTIKTHKIDYPIRPIIADFANPIKYIQKILKIILGHYISKDRFEFIINNTVPIINFCNSCKIKKDHRLISLDYTSMYTNINLDDFYNIIWSEYDILGIKEKFFIDKRDLINIFKNMMEQFAYIKYTMPNGYTMYYKQSRGIPMGGVLSYHISEVVTARHIENMINPSILKIFKYVDDILIICDKNFYTNDLLIIQCLKGMKYELEIEDKKKCIIYLNLELYRHNNKIMHKWYNKKYCSNRTIDYLSAQPRYMKINTLKQLCNTINTSSSTHKILGLEKFRHIAKINHYPKYIIDGIIKDLQNQSIS